MEAACRAARGDCASRLTDRLFSAPAPRKRAAVLVAAVALGLAAGCMPNVQTLVIAVAPKVYVGDPNGVQTADGWRVTAVRTPAATEPSEGELLENLKSFEGSRNE